MTPGEYKRIMGSRRRSKPKIKAKIYGSLYPKLKKKPRHLEDDLQEACVRWFRLQFKKRIIFAIPNGGNRNAFEGMRMKRGGVLSGVADLFIPEPVLRGSSWNHGLWIEMKSEDGTLSPPQRDFLLAMDERRYVAAICHDFEEFTRTVNDYFRGTV